MNCEMTAQSALVKIFPMEGPTQPAYTSLSALGGETASFQLAYRGDSPQWAHGQARVCSPLAQWVRVRSVELMPAAYPCHPETDEGYLCTAPGLYPDYLKDLPDGRIAFVPGQWRSLWVDVELPADAPAGTYPVAVELLGEDGQPLGEAGISLQVCGAQLPPQRLIHTEWFHSDCLADYYSVPVRSEAWWSIVEQFVQTAAKRGVNMLLTPTHTPPLDTEIGGQRTTVQLVDITAKDGGYAFDFTALGRWVEMCRRCGIEYIEIAHLFTQWGAKAAPKVVALVDGAERQIFGWDTPATGEAYAGFLRQYLPALKEALRGMGVLQNTFFHISDEPAEADLESYLAAKQLVAGLLEGCTVIDALSSYRFYAQGIVERPVPANNHITPFIEAGVPNLWTYYCTGQGIGVSNRFFSMPSARNRIIGVQLYKYRIQGFLHWGYNFYNSVRSMWHIDPFTTTDAAGGLPSGDPFLVYPEAGGRAGESIRLMVFAQALGDLRALELLETLAGREFVMGLVEEGLSEPLTFEAYPKQDNYLLELRERVNREICARCRRQ